MKTCLALLLFSLTSFYNFAQSTVRSEEVIKSSILNEEMKYAIYLPDGYETSARKYPVVYLLHGWTDDQTGWVQFGEMQRIVDNAISEGKIAPMIVVMPDAKFTFYMNNVKGEYEYEDYFFKELIPHIEKQYKCLAKKEFRGVAGLSMGGFGTLLYSLKHPDMFAACAAFSAAVQTNEEVTARNDDMFSKRFKYSKSDLDADELNSFLNENNIFELVKKIPENQKNSVHFYIDCGDDDFLYKGNSNLHILMRDLRIPHEYRVRDGGHTWEYWRTGLPDALAFISRDFHR